MSAHREREPQVWEEWAVARAWEDFSRVAGLARMVAPFAIEDWATNNPVPGANGSACGSRVLARRLIDAVVLVDTLLRDMKRRSRKAHGAVKRYLDQGRVAVELRPALAEGKRFVFDWLIDAARRDAQVTQEVT